MGKTLVYQALLKAYRRLYGTEGSNETFSLAGAMESAKKVVLVPERGLESLILTRSFIRGLRQRYPSASITVVTPGEYSSVIDGEYWADRLIFYDDRSKNPFNKSLQRLVSELRDGSFDIAIDLSYRHNLETYLPVYLCGAPITMGFHDPSGTFRYSISLRAAEEDQPYLPRLWSLLRVLDIHPVRDVYHLPGQEAHTSTVWNSVEFGVQTQKDRLIGVFLDETEEGSIGNRKVLADLLKVLHAIPSKKILLAQNRISHSVWHDLPKYDLFVLPRETIAKVASILRGCHCVLTNNNGFALLMASIGGEVLSIAPRKAAEKLSLHQIPGIKFFALKGKEIPAGEISDYLRVTLKSKRAD